MSNRTIEEIVVAAARGEPIGVEARARFEAAVRESEELREMHRSQLALSAELGLLRAALRGVAAEDREATEQLLRDAFHARAERPQRRRVPVLAAVAAVTAVAVITATWLALGRPGIGLRRDAAAGARPPALVLRRAAAPEAPAQALAESSTAVFQPLMYAPRPSAWESYSVVRVRIPLSSLAPSAEPGLRGTVEADVLVGEDGLARAIRFDSAAGFPMSGTAQTGGTE